MGPAWETGAPGGDGRIPFTFRIGVTGHRELADPDALRAAIRKALRGLIELLPVAPAAGLTPVVVSALAEGADRLVAEEILADPDARLEVPLPLSPADYEEDFKTEASKEEFRRLLTRASAVWPAPATEDRNEAYEQAGRYMVDRCDALIALWDGEDPRGQGGTAEIVAYAQEKGVPIAWVNTQGNPEPTYAHSYNQDSRAKVLTQAAGKLRTYNARVIDRAQFDQCIQDLRDELMPDVAREIPIDPLGLSREKVADWVFPYFARADILALHYQSPLPAGQPGHLRAGRSGRGGRRPAGDDLASARLGGRFRGLLPRPPAAHPGDEPPASPARPVDLQPLPGRAAPLELFPGAGRNR